MTTASEVGISGPFAREIPADDARVCKKIAQLTKVRTNFIVSSALIAISDIKQVVFHLNSKAENHEQDVYR